MMEADDCRMHANYEGLARGFNSDEKAA